MDAPEARIGRTDARPVGWTARGGFARATPCRRRDSASTVLRPLPDGIHDAFIVLAGHRAARTEPIDINREIGQPLDHRPLLANTFRPSP
jgi:hypothetical protein